LGGGRPRERAVHGVDFDSIRWDRVRRLTFVPFLYDGTCVLIPRPDPGG
jgi:hypothetical protein